MRPQPALPATKMVAQVHKRQLHAANAEHRRCKLPLAVMQLLLARKPSCEHDAETSPVLSRMKVDNAKICVGAGSTKTSCTDPPCQPVRSKAQVQTAVHGNGDWRWSNKSRHSCLEPPVRPSRPIQATGMWCVGYTDFLGFTPPPAQCAPGCRRRGCLPCCQL